MTDKKKLEHLAYVLKDRSSLRNLFAELNFDFADEPVNKENWNDSEKEIVLESKIVAKKNDYRVYYLQTKTDSLKHWKSIATKIIKENHGFCLVCSHNPSGFKWVFSSLSKDFSKSFTETRHVPIEVRPNIGVPNNFVDFLDKIRVGKDPTPISISTQISEAFDTFAIQIHNELTVNVFEALKVLSEGIIGDKSNNLSLSDKTLDEIRKPIFILLYRIIFILYAEDRAIFPVEDTTYYEKFSLKWLKEKWLLESFDLKKIAEYGVQKRLKSLFRLIEVGSEELDYNKEEFFMRSYYGRIFDRKINSELENWNIPNSKFLDTLSLLTSTKDKSGNTFFLDYSALETKHLGSIYEHLLEFHLHVKGEKIAKLPNAKERKLTGSYYTPQDIVDYFIKNTIKPIIDKIVKETNDKHEQKEKILSLKILDPAMGSGHFLVSVMNFVAKKICEVEDDLSESNIIERKREVVRRCIYGVDLNPLAVDLTKVSLWLETLASEKPLSFLSAHVKCGNSIIGSSIDTLFEKQMTLNEAQKGREYFKKSVKDFLTFENLEDDSGSAVKAKLEKYRKMQSEGTIFYDLMFLLNCKSAEMFGVVVPALGDYRAKIGENSMDFYTSKPLQNVKELSEKYRMFNWEIEFPEIFYDNNGIKLENPGFDIIIGNPPYVEKSSLGYPSLMFETDKSGNIYAYFIENSIKFLKNGGRFGFIVPLSAFCTQRMEELQILLEKNCSSIYTSHYGWRPSKLFKNVNRAVSIFFVEKSTEKRNADIYTTTYMKWYSSPVDERPQLFEKIKYQKLSEKFVPFIIPKIGTELESQLLKKINSFSITIGNFICDKKTKHVIFYRSTGGLYWKIITDFQPKFYKNGIKQGSSRESHLYFSNEEEKKIALAFYNSNLFWWYYTINSNCRDLNPYDLKSFPIDFGKITVPIKKKLINLVSILMKDLDKNSVFAERRHKNKDPVKFQQISPRKSKAVIDQIDETIAKIYGFTNEETNFLIHFDERFRMGNLEEDSE